MPALLAARIITGIGIGGMISSTTAMVFEFATMRRRGLAMGLMAVGFPAGATLGASVALALVAEFGWRSVFLVGGLAAASMLPVVALLMPESPAFLLQSRRPDALTRANRMLARMRRPILSALPAPDGGLSAPAMGFRALLGPVLRARTARMSVLFLLVMQSFYFILNWAPKLVVQLGLPVSAGLSAGLLINLGGMAGGLAAGLLIPRLGLAATGRGAIALMAMAIMAFGIVAADAAALPVLSAVLGFAMFATMACIYTLMSENFPPQARATAIGLVSTVGRVGSVLGPLFGGILLERGISVPLACLLLGVPALLAIAAIGRR